MSIYADFELHTKSIDQRGYSVIPGVFSDHDIESLRSEIAKSLLQADGKSMKSRGGIVYAARNIFDCFPTAKTCWIKPRLCDLLEKTLGTEYGLVRGLYFDKPPERSWSLPWHNDKTIAVNDNSLPSTQFNNPTHKSGRDHVEAPNDLLMQMLTLRIHLDDVTNENGPLQVIPGSHLTGEMKNDPQHSPEPIYASAGDVLAMRPLLSHCSGNASIGTTQHRRIIHLEFASNILLPDSYQWQDFITTCEVATES